MGKILEVTEAADLEQIDRAYNWMEEDRKKNDGKVFPTTYSTITDYYAPFDMHIAFFYDTKNERLYARTYIYASGTVIYEEIKNPEKLVNESEDSRAIAWMLIRTGVYLSNS